MFRTRIASIAVIKKITRSKEEDQASSLLDNVRLVFCMIIEKEEKKTERGRKEDEEKKMKKRR